MIFLPSFQAVQLPSEEILRPHWQLLEEGREEDALHVGDEVDLLDGLVQPGFFVQLLQRNKSRFYSNLVAHCLVML